jgi:hypothetical protein
VARMGKEGDRGKGEEGVRSSQVGVGGQMLHPRREGRRWKADVCRLQQGQRGRPRRGRKMGKEGDRGEGSANLKKCASISSDRRRLLEGRNVKCKKTCLFAVFHILYVTF